MTGDIAPSPIECCASKISDIDRDCGDRNSENCNVYFTVGGRNCTPCFCKQIKQFISMYFVEYSCSYVTVTFKHYRVAVFV